VTDQKKQDQGDAAPSEAGGCWNCDVDTNGKLEQMFVGIVETRRIQLGQTPARRPVFLKPHGVAHGRFEIQPDLPENLRVGVFARDGYDVWVRFSSDTQPTSPDLRSTLGIGIKLFGVPGPKLLGDGDTQDFILQNHDVFFVNNARDFCEFTRAGVVEGDYGPYLRKHPETRRILKEMETPEASCLTTTYWSVLPYALGDTACKYKLVPEALPDHVAPTDMTNYLATDLRARLLAGEVRFKFMVQLRTDPEAMPLDEATVRWSEAKSHPIHVATLVLPRQDVEALGQASYGDNLAFNPWHCLPAHEPLGSISAARKVVYQASSVERRNANGVPIMEPGPARPASALPVINDDCIVKAAIYPPIGVARIGDAEEEYFIGPEVAEPLPEAPGFYRDSAGALKRQAARFRVYGLNAEGKVVRELTGDPEVEIEWTVHLANQKSAWYQFQLALDIPEAESAPPSLLRNATVSDRSSLIIDPGARHISGADKSGRKYAFDSGKFVGKEVYLGELQTDEAGRLVVLGGRGVSASYNGTPAITFANNEGWHDDTSDGPVTARVHYRRKKLEVAPAWVIVAPPNYAPMRKSVRTMWDLMRDVSVTAGTLPRPSTPSFADDIAPLFQRMNGLQWVNAGFAAAFGWKGPNDLSTHDWLSRLNDPSLAGTELRRTISNQFRRYDRDAWSPVPWPWLYGDAMNVPAAHTPRQNSTLTNLQLAFLDQWVQGQFIADYDPARQPPRTLEDVPVAEQGDMLTRAAMEFCLADAFHPGCEMTWPMRTASMYLAPYRLKQAKANQTEPSYGALLNSDSLTLPDGPLTEQYPGSITRWMAIPWQTDTASCRSGYEPSYDPYVPSFWPARVPNQVLSARNYQVVIDTAKPLDQRLAAFAFRANWDRPLGLDKSYTHQINWMIKHFGRMGVVEVREGPAGDPAFPPVMEVEDRGPEDWRGRKVKSSGSDEAVTEETELSHGSEPERTDLSGIEKVRRFPRGLR
jgi:hypothetical protein